MSGRSTPVEAHRTLGFSPASSFSSHLDELEFDVDHVSRQALPPLVFGRESVPPRADFQARTSLLTQELEEYGRAERVDAVATVALGRTQGEAEYEARGVERAGGYVLIPENREFNPQDYLTQGKAPLWFSTRSTGGVGRSVEMTKEVEDKDKKPESDVERQEKFDEKFAFLKYKLGLTKDDVVNYSINGHGIEIYDRDGNLKGKYDLLDNGLNEDPRSPVIGGGGLKQLLRDRGIILTDTQIKELSQELKGINSEMGKIIEPETGGRLAYAFEAGNRGNIQGLVPFIPRTSVQAEKVLRTDEKRGFYVRTMQRLGLVNTDSRIWPRSDKHTLTPKGAATINDIHRATDLQRIIMQNIERKKAELQAELQRITPPEPVIPNAVEQGQIDAVKKEIGELNKIKREIAQVNPSVLNLMLMHLNSSITVSHQAIRAADGRMLSGQQTARPGKVFLGQMSSQSRPNFGVQVADTHGADVVRNNLVDQVATDIARSFEKTVMQENPNRELNYYLGIRKKPLKSLDPDKRPDHKEIQQMATNMGALVHDIAATTSSDPSRMRKARFIEGQTQSGFASESRGLEFIIAAAIFRGYTGGLRGYERENDTVKDILGASLVEFRRRDHAVHKYTVAQPGYDVSSCREILSKAEERIGKGISSPLPRSGA